eukprot:265201-Pyramimonas_sp.AAC.2
MTAILHSQGSSVFKDLLLTLLHGNVRSDPQRRTPASPEVQPKCNERRIKVLGYQGSSGLKQVPTDIKAQRRTPRGALGVLPSIYKNTKMPRYLMTFGCKRTCKCCSGYDLVLNLQSKS